MSEVLLEKVTHIEDLLVSINLKIDNFMGFEELDEEEKREVTKIKKEMDGGEYHTFNDVFGD